MKIHKIMVVWAGIAMLATCAAIASANEGGGHGGGGGGGGSPGSLPLEPMVVNLQSGHYVQIKPIVKLDDPADTETVKAWTPLLRHELIKFLIGRESNEVSSPQFMKAFSDEATEVLNKALHNKYIKDVIFDSWLVQ